MIIWNLVHIRNHIPHALRRQFLKFWILTHENLWAVETAQITASKIFLFCKQKISGELLFKMRNFKISFENSRCTSLGIGLLMYQISQNYEWDIDLTIDRHIHTHTHTNCHLLIYNIMLFQTKNFYTLLKHVSERKSKKNF